MNEATLSFIVIVAVMVAFFLIFIWPSQREQRRRAQDMRELRPGDDVLTTGGLIAKVREIETPEDGPVLLLLELADGVCVRAVASSIQQRINPGRLAELDAGARVVKSDEEEAARSGRSTRQGTA